MAITFDFDRIATNYETWYESPVGRKMVAQEKAAIQEHLASPASHRSILEVGCGTGFWSQWLASLGYDIMGIDVSQRMIDEAQRKHIPNGRFLQSDICDFHSHERFDIVIAITALEFIREYEKALDRMVHLLAPNGQLIIAVLNQYSPLGLERKILPNASEVYKNAHFFDLWELEKMLLRYGQPRLSGSTFASSFSLLLPFADTLEWLGKTIIPQFGNLLVGSVFVP